MTDLASVRAPLGFDAALPALPVIDDAEAVARLLAPGLGPVEVRRQDTKYEPGLRCVAAYEIRSRAGGSPATVLGALVVTGDEVEGYPAERDPALPRLADALDGTVVGPRLAATFPTGIPTGLPVVVPVRYKPGTRCVIRYEVGDGARPVLLYGKLLARGSGAQATTMTGLARAMTVVDGAPRVLPLLAHWPDLGLLVQPAVLQAAELHGVVTDPTTPPARRRPALMDAGAALAALHCCELPEAPRRSFADDVAELRGYQAAVATADPPLGAAYATVLRQLETRAGDSPDAPDVVGHGAFRTDQLLGSGDRLTLIDLDTVCRSEPARDIGNLLAYLDWKVIRRAALASALASAAGEFLDGYARRRRLPAPHRITLYRAASLLKIAGRRFRGLTVDEWHLVPALVAAAGELLATAGTGGGTA